LAGNQGDRSSLRPSGGRKKHHPEKIQRRTGRSQIRPFLSLQPPHHPHRLPQKSLPPPFLDHYEQRSGKHPIIIFDDGDGLSDRLIELLRSLANFAMDSEDRFSFILSGSQKLALRLKQPQNEAFRQRIVFAHSLRAFTIEDARNYIRFHLERAEGPKELFTEGAVQFIFHLAKGLPRVINQIALQAIIRAAIRSVDKIDENFLKQQVLNDSLFDGKLEE
jgi:hypothetical protein